MRYRIVHDGNSYRPERCVTRRFLWWQWIVWESCADFRDTYETLEGAMKRLREIKERDRIQEEREARRHEWRPIHHEVQPAPDSDEAWLERMKQEVAALGSQ